jgi:hypothetical protein
VIRAAVLAAALGLSRVPSQDAVDAVEREALRARVPVSLALAVCTLESGLGTRGAILCGCMVRDHSPAAQARCIAGTLAHGRGACGSWAGALRRYRYGLRDHGCPLADPRGYVTRVDALQRAVARVVGGPAVSP